jgi:hypothetical protein
MIAHVSMPQHDSLPEHLNQELLAPWHLYWQDTIDWKEDNDKQYF